MAINILSKWTAERESMGCPLPKHTTGRHFAKRIAEVLTEGRQIQQKILADKRFANAVAGLAEKEMFGPLTRKWFSTSPITDPEKAESDLIAGAQRIRIALDLCSLSSVPVQYAAFLATKPGGIDEFVDSMPLFVRRRPSFNRVSDGTKLRASEFKRMVASRVRLDIEKLMELIGEPVRGVIKATEPLKPPRELRQVVWEIASEIGIMIQRSSTIFIDSLPFYIRFPRNTQSAVSTDDWTPAQNLETVRRYLPAIGLYPRIISFLTTGELLLSIENIESYFEFGTIRMFVVSKTKSNGYVHGLDAIIEMTDPKDLANEETIQHELQHVFDSLIMEKPWLIGSEDLRYPAEYRAYLACLAFSPTTLIPEIYSKIYSKICGEDASVKECHLLAKRRIRGKLGRPSKWSRNPERLAEKALKLLNAAYEKAVGLTYDQIVEPFGRIMAEAD